MKSYIAHVSRRRLFRALNIESNLARPVIIQIPTQSPGRYTAELPLRRIKLFSFQANSPYVPSTHTLWIFWKLRLRPLRFFYVQLQVSQTSHLIYVVLRAPGGGPRVVVSTAAFHARVRGSVPGLGGLKETILFLPHPRVKVSIVGSLRDREVACSASDRQGPNFESCVWRTVSSQSSHHPQEVLLAQFSLYVHKGGLKPDSFHFISLSPTSENNTWQSQAVTHPIMNRVRSCLTSVIEPIMMSERRIPYRDIELSNMFQWTNVYMIHEKNNSYKV